MKNPCKEQCLQHRCLCGARTPIQRRTQPGTAKTRSRSFPDFPTVVAVNVSPRCACRDRPGRPGTVPRGRKRR
jgi:hypothetical protein